MTQKDFENAANYWKQKERTEMPKEQLKEKIEAYIQANNTCALAYARSLYEKLGFEQISEEFLEDGIPHIKMKLKL